MKYTYSEEQVKHMIDIINNFEFIQGKNISNSQRTLMILNIINNPISVVKTDEKKTDEELLEEDIDKENKKKK